MKTAALRRDVTSTAVRVKVGVISDTHGLLRPEAVAAIAGTDLIIHAGDVGAPEILGRLRTLAPVVAVRGNIDREPWASRLPLTEVVELETVTAYVIHDIDALDLNPVAAGIQVIIFGHSHRPEARVQDGVLYLNPGSAGPRRFSLPTTVAQLDVVDGRPHARLIELDIGGPRSSAL
jgi:uncharacterized protein